MPFDVPKINVSFITNRGKRLVVGMKRNPAYFAFMEGFELPEHFPGFSIESKYPARLGSRDQMFPVVADRKTRRSFSVGKYVIRQFFTSFRVPDMHVALIVRCEQPRQHRMKDNFLHPTVMRHVILILLRHEVENPGIAVPITAACGHQGSLGIQGTLDRPILACE